jgi:hypothetical protein
MPAFFKELATLGGFTASLTLLLAVWSEITFAASTLSRDALT